MDWKEFIEGESGRHGLSKEQMETLLETLCSSTDAHTNQQKIADKFNISVLEFRLSRSKNTIAVRRANSSQERQ